MTPEPPVSWRLTHESDAPFLRELHDLNRPEFQFLPPEVRLPVLAMQYSARQQGHLARYSTAKGRILLLDSLPFGQMLLWEDRKQVHLVDFAVLPQFQGQGLGAAALRLLQGYAAPRAVGLQVAVGSPAQRLYTRLGFGSTGHDEMNVQMQWPVVANGQ